jgi:hypothetical protein
VIPFICLEVPQAIDEWHSLLTISNSLFDGEFL